MNRWVLLFLCLLLALPLGAEELPADVWDAERGTLEIPLPEDVPPGTNGTVRLRMVGSTTGRKLKFQVQDGMMICAVAETGRTLLPGRYRIEAKLADSERAWTLTVGSESERQKARKQAADRLLEILGRLRRLYRTVGQQGRFIENQIRARGEKPAKKTLDYFHARWKEIGPFVDEVYEETRRDLIDWLRFRLVSPFPDEERAVVSLLKKLSTFRRAWDERIRLFVERKPLSPSEIETIEKRILVLARTATEGLEGRFVGWDRMDLARLERGGRSKDGDYVSRTFSFRLPVPEGWSLKKGVASPRIRVHLSHPDGLSGMVEVLDFPEIASSDALPERLEVLAWESWQSYKKLAGDAVEGGYDLRFEMKVNGERRRARWRVRYGDDPSRVVGLLVFGPPEAMEKQTGTLDALFDGFRAGEDE